MNQQQMSTQNIALSGLLLAIGVLLPQVFHTFGGAGPIFLPMHIPVFLAGFLIGPWAGIFVGLLSPSLSHITSGMPILAFLPFMTIELVLYGAISGFLRKKLPTIVTLLVAQIVGRGFYAIVLIVLGWILNAPIPAAKSIVVSATIGLPGIIIQILLLPILIRLLRQRRIQA